MELEATGILTQDVEPGGTTLVDECNSFNKLSRMKILWTVHNRWPARERFVFNFCKYWAHILLLQPNEAPVMLPSQEGVNQCDPLLMVL